MILCFCSWENVTTYGRSLERSNLWFWVRVVTGTAWQLAVLCRWSVSPFWPFRNDCNVVTDSGRWCSLCSFGGGPIGLTMENPPVEARCFACFAPAAAHVFATGACGARWSYSGWDPQTFRPTTRLALFSMQVLQCFQKTSFLILWKLGKDKRNNKSCKNMSEKWSVLSQDEELKRNLLNFPMWVSFETKTSQTNRLTNIDMVGAAAMATLEHVHETFRWYATLLSNACRGLKEMSSMSPHP